MGIPISGWMGDNLLKKTTNMDWWKGMDVPIDKETIHVDTLYDVFNDFFRVPERPSSAPMRMPISGIYKIKGVGDVLAGRVEQGIVKPGEDVIFLPTHTASNPCAGNVFSVEMHHTRVDFASPGDNVGYSPIGFVRCGRSACRISKIAWKMGKETGGKKMEEPHSLKSNEMAECKFQPQQPLVCDTFKNCEGLSRVAFMDGNGVVMLGKVVSCERKEEAAGGGKKK